MPIQQILLGSGGGGVPKTFNECLCTHVSNNASFAARPTSAVGSTSGYTLPDNDDTGSGTWPDTVRGSGGWGQYPGIDGLGFTINRRFKIKSISQGTTANSNTDTSWMMQVSFGQGVVGGGAAASDRMQQSTIEAKRTFSASDSLYTNIRNQSTKKWISVPFTSAQQEVIYGTDGVETSWWIGSGFTRTNFGGTGMFRQRSSENGYSANDELSSTINGTEVKMKWYQIDFNARTAFTCGTGDAYCGSNGTSLSNGMATYMYLDIEL